MNIENNYFHGLAGNIVVYNPQLIVNTSLKQLDMILKTKGIYSRNKLKELGIDYLKHKGVFNGEDYISICIKNIPTNEFTGKNEGLESSYIKYTENTISIIISKDIEDIYTFRKGNYDYLPGERQVKDGISSEYFIGIKVSFKNKELTKIVGELISEVLQNNGVDLPIYDNELNLINNKTKTY